MLKTLKLASGVACVFVLLVGVMWGQGIFATLTGVVSDPAGAVVANAKVVLTDSVSGSARDSVSNSEGFFTFASVPVGTYKLSVEASGFQVYKADNISLGGGERRNVNVTLTVGSASQTIEVSAENTAVATVDSGEKSFALTTKELQNFTQLGSNAAEYVKITPGFAISNGTSNKTGYSGAVIGINANGDGGTSQSPLNNNFSYNGLKNNSLDIVADGAHVSDPGCNCDTPVNPNSDFLQEFKVLTSNFSAENQKGPALITSVTKSGGSSFHGSGFFSARNAALNSNDWLNNHQGLTKPQNKFYYPGGSIGGPVIIPGTGFNKSRQKLFFFAGFEYFHQVLDTGRLNATVPTDGERTGLFSPDEVAKEGTNAPWGTPQAVNPTTFPGYQIPMCAANAVPDGTCGDPKMLALMNLFPKSNADPASTGGFNYVQSEIFNQNNRQLSTRVDYNISDNTKVFVRYNYQREVQLFPIGLWWRQTDQVPYPSQVQGRNKSDSITGTITHVFSPTMTNETVMAYTYIGFPNVFANPKAVDRTSVGYTYAGLFGNGVAQIPSFGGSGNQGEAALVFNPGGFEAGGASAGLYADKWMPSISDTFTKVVKTHTLKAGFFFEWIRNSQPANNNTNGHLQFLTSNVKTYGNAYADMLTGNIASYDEASKNRINDISYKTTEFFVQDSWKLTRKLTLDLGIRLTHFTPWTDDEGFGYSTFDPAKYNPANNGACAAGPTFCGFDWHARNSSIPLTGFPTRALYYQPRVGFAYDLFGSGKTILRGGYGRFYYHSGQFTSGLDASAGVLSASLSPTNWDSNGAGDNCPAQPGGATLLLASNLSCIIAAKSPSAPFAVDRKDDKQPYTDDWSFTIAQRTPWQGLLEAAYVGNRSRDQLSTGGAGSNLNLVPLGAMSGLANPSAGDPNQFRPLLGYGDLNTAVNNIYTNYNGMQITWGRHTGRYTLQANYAWQKSLGIVQPGNPANGPSVTLNPYTLASNYGTMANDRRQLFNIAYSIDLGRHFRGQKFLGGVANGWQISGVTQIQSGANLTFLSSNDNFGMSINCVNPAGDNTDPCGRLQNHNAIIPGSISATNPQGIAITNQSILGTNAVQLSPLVTCNPRSGLSSHQFLNGSCFAAPSVAGQNGPALLPVVYGPAYFNSDLSLFKNFEISESKKLQFRIQAYNFLNHPLWTFSGTNNLGLTFQQDPTTQVITQSNATFGKTTTKEGNRVIEFIVKFYF